MHGRHPFKSCYSRSLDVLGVFEACPDFTIIVQYINIIMLYNIVVSCHLFTKLVIRGKLQAHRCFYIGTRTIITALT